MSLQEYYSNLLQKLEKPLKAVTVASLALAIACIFLHPLAACFLCALSAWAVVSLIIIVGLSKKTPSA